MYTQKVEQFLNEVRKLCREYDLQIAVSDYDAIEIWELHPGEQEIDARGINDFTYKQ